MDGFATAARFWDRRADFVAAEVRRLCVAVVACAILAFPCPAPVRAQGIIETILGSVRGESDDEADEESPKPEKRRREIEPSCEYSHEPWISTDESHCGGVLFDVTFYGVTSPFWLPCAALGDDYSLPEYFPRFPYDNVEGHLAEGSGRVWSGRFNVEYIEPFNDVSGIGGRFLLSTTSRFGVDAEANHFEERRPAGRFDTLWVGDCNAVFRFAQSEKAEFRAGLGFNWLDCPDPLQRQTDFGFNFTYGADFFPRKPWVVSADLDVGTLGRAGLFRFRATGGILIRGVEAYTGYEYLDIGGGHLNMLVTGLRAWF